MPLREDYLGRYLRMLCLVASGLWLCSCQDFFDREVEPNFSQHESKQAMSVILDSSFDTARVYASRSLDEFSLSDNIFADVQQMTLYRNNDWLAEATEADRGVFEFRLPSDWWQGDARYELRCQATDLPDIYAQTFALHPVKPVQATFTENTFINPAGDTLDQIQVHFDNLPDSTFVIIAPQCQIIDTQADTVVPTQDTVRWYSPQESISFFNSQLHFRSLARTHDLLLLTDNLPSLRHAQAYRIILSCTRISPAHFAYNRSLQTANDIKNNPFSEPVIIPSNIVGGYGVFAVTGTHRDTL